ncbi:MAG: orotidine-5'-phosphate decarboxylase [Defluviitaleaceae bacterium]|nr:orotidine-5'-phosphate decarboxylase [Defluviitaleaceae bacterium]
MVIDLLIEKILQLKNPSVVGLDPRAEFLPLDLEDAAIERYGKTPRAMSWAFFEFNKAIIDAIFDIVPAVKPQIGMYEQFGPEGISSYIQTIKYAKSKGLIVIGDIKRGDIASTAQDYSNGHIGEVCVFGEKTSIFDEDFITINPYLGADSIIPFLENCDEYGRGLFVLAKTSNKGSGDLQDLLVDGRPIYEIMGANIARWGEGLIGKYGYSSVGAVVGATYPSQIEALRKIAPNTFFLVPGYGAQGGKAEDLATCFDSRGMGGIVNSSRGIIAAYQNEKYSHLNYAQAARAAALDMRDDLAKYINFADIDVNPDSEEDVL